MSDLKLVAWVKGDNEYHERGEATPSEIRAAAESAGFLVVDREEAEEVTFFAPHIFPARDNPEYDLEFPAGRYYVVAVDVEEVCEECDGTGQGAHHGTCQFCNGSGRADAEEAE